jgi:hypothetical protein
LDWNNKTIQFNLNNKPITIQGLQNPPIKPKPISATQLYNDTLGNDTWAFVIVESTPTAIHPLHPPASNPPPPIQHLLDKYSQVFHDPQTLPPPRSYDHSIPLLPRAIPVNARPYHYSPQHKNKIEDQVKKLLQAVLITHSYSPFASPMLLVKKRWNMEILC